MKYKVVLHRTNEGISVSVPALPGCWSEGDTEEEALANIQDAIGEHLAALDDQVQGAEVREVEAPEEASGMPGSPPAFSGRNAGRKGDRHRRQATVEERYAALLLFQLRVVCNGSSNRRRVCEKRLLVLRAASARGALLEARRRGRLAQYQYDNDQGHRVHFEFVGVLDLLHLGLEAEEDEMWYQICELLEPMERRDQLLPVESELQALAEERNRDLPIRIGGARRKLRPRLEVHRQSVEVTDS